jgi:molybdenum cofactor cytidylyltransferase
LEARESRAPDQAGSLAVGVRALAAQGHDACVLVVPVDTLPASEETLWRLRRALAHGVDAVCPTFGGRGGHPVLVREQVLATYRARGTPPPLREVLAALGARWLKLPVQDSAVATDLDEPADVERLTGHGPRFAETPFPLRAVLARLPTVRP